MGAYNIINPADQKIESDNFSPPHPGGFIREEIFEPFGLTIVEAANRLGVNRPTLNKVILGQHAVSDDLAYKIEALTGVDGDLLLALQRDYDRARSMEKREAFRRAIPRLSMPEPA